MGKILSPKSKSKMLLKLNKKDTVHTVKSLLNLLMIESENMDNRHNKIISLFKRDALLWNSKKYNKVFVVPNKCKNMLPKNESLILDFGSEAYFDIFFTHFNLILEERNNKRKEITELLNKIITTL